MHIYYFLYMYNTLEAKRLKLIVNYFILIN